MKIVIFYTLMILAVIPIGTAFADEPLILVNTDDINYDEGDTIFISGTVFTIIGDTQVTMQLFYEGNMIEIAQIKVALDGNYSHTVLAEGPQWKNQGDYIVKVVYGEDNVAETSFNYTPESDIVEITNNFEVNAGNGGTFDVKYTIRGGTLEGITVEPENFGLMVKISTLDDGKILLELPREFIDAEKQNGKDEEFIILINNVQTTYEESLSFSEVRTITINFEEGDSEIQIIGTYVIPEFGTLVMIILTIGIMTSILLTRNRFQIKI
jgi:predicted secreted protein with PEFG-CTERM motif